MTGRELKRIADTDDLKPAEVCSEAKVSINTLYKVYNDVPVSQRSKLKVQEAISRLAARARALAVS